MIVVSDASPINVLVRIEQAEILPQLFGRVIIPPAVLSELTHSSTPSVVRELITAGPRWLKVQAPNSLNTTLPIDDPGEVEAISLALEMRADYLLVDDRKARRVAIQLGLSITGAIGVLELAATKGLLDLFEAFERVRKTDFKVSERILRESLLRFKDR